MLDIFALMYYPNV